MAFEIDPFTGERIFVPEPSQRAATPPPAAAPVAPAAPAPAPTPAPEVPEHLRVAIPEEPVAPAPLPNQPQRFDTPQEALASGIGSANIGTIRNAKPVARFNSRMERLKAYKFKERERQLVQQGRTGRSVVQKGNVTVERKGALGTRMEPREVEAAYEKLNQVNDDPQNAPAITEREWEGLNEGLRVTVTGREMLRDRQQAQKNFGEKLEEAKLTWDSYEDMNAWLDENKADPLIADWASGQVANNVLSDKATINRFQATRASETASQRQERANKLAIKLRRTPTASELKADKVAGELRSNQDAARDQNKDKFIAWNAKKIERDEQLSPQDALVAARGSWDAYKKGLDVDVELYEEFERDPVNRAYYWSKSKNIVLQTEPSAEQVEDSKKRAVLLAGADEVPPDLADPVQYDVYVEQFGVSKTAANFKRDLEQTRNAAPDQPEKIAITFQGSGNGSDAIAADVASLVVDKGIPYATALRTVIKDEVDAGSISGVKEQELYNQLYSPVLDSVDEVVNAIIKKAQVKNNEAIARRRAPVNEDVQNLVDKFSHQVRDSISFKTKIDALGNGNENKGIEQWILGKLDGYTGANLDYIEEGITRAQTDRESAQKNFAPFVDLVDRVAGAYGISEGLQGAAAVVSTQEQQQRVRDQDQIKTDLRERGQVPVFAPNSASVEATFGNDAEGQERMARYLSPAGDTAGKAALAAEEKSRLDLRLQEDNAIERELEFIRNDTILKGTKSLDPKTGKKVRTLGRVNIDEDISDTDWENAEASYEAQWRDNPNQPALMAEFFKKKKQWVDSDKKKAEADLGWAVWEAKIDPEVPVQLTPEPEVDTGTAPEFAEGATATNSETGEKVVFRSGKWETAQ